MTRSTPRQNPVISVTKPHSQALSRNGYSKRLAEARSILWSFDSKCKRAKSNDGFPSVISLAEGGSLRRPHLEVLLNIQHSLFSPHEYEPATYYFDQFLPELGEELQRFFRERCGIDWVRSQHVCIGVGSSHILDGLFSALLHPGDLVLTSAPFYHAFADFTVKWESSLEVIGTSESNGFKLTAPDLEKWFSLHAEDASRAKLLLLTNPSTIGTVYTRQELEELAAVIKRHRLPVFVDEVYRDCVFGDTEMISLASLPGMEEFVVTAHSGSKTRGFADFRIGWACGPENLIKEIIHFAEHSVTLVPLITQRAAIEVLRTPQRYFDADREECQKRADLIKTLVEQVNQLTRATHGRDAIRIPVPPEAGHAILLDFSPLCGQEGWITEDIRSDLLLTRYLGSQTRVSPHGEERCGVLFAPCYSNGLNGYYVRAAFAEVGHDNLAVNTGSEVFAAFESLIRAHSGLAHISPERISAAARLVGLEGAISVQAQEQRTRLAFSQGRALIGEAFARVAHGILCLKLPHSANTRATQLAQANLV